MGGKQLSHQELNTRVILLTTASPQSATRSLVMVMGRIGMACYKASIAEEQWIDNKCLQHTACGLEHGQLLTQQLNLRDQVRS